MFFTGDGQVLIPVISIRLIVSSYPVLTKDAGTSHRYSPPKKCMSKSSLPVIGATLWLWHTLVNHVCHKKKKRYFNTPVIVLTEKQNQTTTIFTFFLSPEMYSFILRMFLFNKLWGMESSGINVDQTYLFTEVDGILKIVVTSVKLILIKISFLFVWADVKFHHLSIFRHCRSCIVV